MEPQEKTMTEIYYTILESITWDAMHHDGQWQILMGELEAWLEKASGDDARRLHLLLAGSAGLLDSAREAVLFHEWPRKGDA